MENGLKSQQFRVSVSVHCKAQARMIRDRFNDIAGLTFDYVTNEPEGSHDLSTPDLYDQMLSPNGELGLLVFEGDVSLSAVRELMEAINQGAFNIVLPGTARSTVLRPVLQAEPIAAKPDPNVTEAALLPHL